MLTPFLALLNRHARLILAGGIFAGLVLPDLASLLRPLVEAAVVASLSLSLLRIDWATVMDWGRRPLRAAAGLGWILIGAPLLTLGAVTLLGLPPGLSVGKSVV